MVVYVDIEEVYLIHQAMIVLAGGKGGVRDFALLHSAVERPKATFDSKDLYPTVFAKAAALLQSLCMNHAFTDGNKRTAYVSTKRFLWINGYNLLTKTMEAVDFMVMVDNERLDLASIMRWLRAHSSKMPG
jgi:death on curing protein